MAFKDRINALISYLKISRAEFERRAGLSNGYTRNLGGVPGAEKLESILRTFPEVSRDWLLTGEGEMLKNSTEVEINSIPEARPAEPDQISLISLWTLVQSQQRTLEDNAATIKQQTEELAALRKKVEALTEEGLRVDVPSLHPAPSPAGSLV